MADSFFGFDTSLSNLNDDEGGGEPSEDEYDALNDETFGQDVEGFDWEVEHEHLAEQLESSRRNAALDEADSRLEASLSQLVLDDSDALQPRALGSNVWRHDVPMSSAPTPVPSAMKNVCTVEELERQLRQNQMPQHNYNQNYFQPRFPMILQRPPGLQAPVPLPYAPQQSMAPNHQNMNQMTSTNPMMNQTNQIGQHNQMMPNHMSQSQIVQNINQVGQNVNPFMQKSNQMGPFQNNQMGQPMNHVQPPPNMQMNQMGQNSMIKTQMGQNMQGLTQNQSMGPNMNQVGQNVNQMGHNSNQMGQNVNQMGQNVNQMGQNINRMGHSMNQMGQNLNKMGQNIGQMVANMCQMGPNVNQRNPNINQMAQNVNQLAQNVNQMGQNINHMSQNQINPNGAQFGPGMNQFNHMMNQPRMMAPPPGLSMPKQNFNPNMNQFNPNFRSPVMPTKNDHNPNSGNQQMHMNQTSQINQNIMKSNQPSQSPQNKNQKPVQRQDAKLQKSRVYNNSKNLTSQNLVQLIQNTHPMLQYNSTYHNASHHPILNNRNAFNSQFVNNHPMFNNQRQNGTYGTNRHSNSDGSDGSASGDADEYAGLMTQREKQWLVNIQMLQLNTGTPYIHDFYYTVFLERQANKAKEGVKEAHKANQQNHPFYSGGSRAETERTPRERHGSLRLSTGGDEAPRAYVPLQFENSLGKLQCGSVTAPRKIIDVDVVSAEPASGRGSRAPSVASTTNPAEVPREMRRTKQLLLDIESLYLILLRLEELNDPLAISNALILKEREEKQKLMDAIQKETENEEEVPNLFLKNIESVQRRKQDSPKMESIDKRQVVNLAVSQKPPVKNLLDEDKEELLNKMFSGLMYGDRLQQMLTVRKGRALVARFVCRAPASHSWVRALWARLLRALSAAARRDEPSAPLLPRMAQPYRNYIQNTTGWPAVLESCGLLSEALDPARTHYALLTPLTLSCVCALIEKAIVLVNTPEATSNERQWYRFLKTLARALKNTNLTVARPVKPLPEATLLHHLKQLESRSTIEILQRGKTAEFGDLMKTDVTEQLIKHLC